MSKIIEEIVIEQNSCIAMIYLEFLGGKFCIARKISNDGFKTVNVDLYKDIYTFATNEQISGYTVYDLLTNVQEAIKDGNYKNLYTTVKKFNEIENRARSDIKEFGRFSNHTANKQE